MDKTTVELDRIKDHWAQWGVLSDKWGGGSDSSLVLDLLIEWSKKNPEAKIYRHLLRCVEENVSAQPTLKTSSNGTCEVYLCDRVVYLDIYYQ